MTTQTTPLPTAFELAPHAHRMTLWGAPDAAEFPPVCPNCGSAAATSLRLAKGFRRSSGSDTPDVRVVISVSVPFCNDCIARHRAEARTPGLLPSLLSSFGSGNMFAAVGFGTAAAFTGYHAFDELLRGRPSHFGVFAGLTAVFGLIARIQGKIGWQETEYVRVPVRTSVTQAFDYSDNEPAPFESAKYECTFRDDRFAAAFKALNRQLEFQPGSVQAQADRRNANRQAWIVGIVVAAIALLFLVRDFLKQG